MPFDYDAALRRRMGLLDQMGQSQTTWNAYQVQKAKAKAEADRQQALYRSAIEGYNALGSLPVGSVNVNNNSGPTAFNATGAGSTGDPGFNNFMKGIAAVESGGNYGVRNASSGAMGKYQIMPANLGGTGTGWDKEILGYDVNVSQFMGSPQIQDAIATGKLKQYYDKYGPSGAAIAWYAGPGRVNNPNQDMRNYASKVIRNSG